eukprot:jgi/Botrbrau1/23220/Bobra.0041s0063.1
MPSFRRLGPAATTQILLVLPIHHYRSLISFRMATVDELACVYAALILHDDGLEISGDNINTLVKAANITVEPYWPALFAKLFERNSIESLLTSVGSGGGGGAVAAAPAAGGGGAPAGEAKKEEKKKEEEPEEEEDDDMGFSLFD